MGGRRRDSAAVPPPRVRARGVAVAVLERFSRKARWISARGAVAERGLGPETCAGRLTGVGPAGGGDQGMTGATSTAAVGGGARSWVARRAEALRWSRMRRMTVPSVMNAATCRAHALGARTDERFNLVHAAKELSPSTTKSGQRGGHGGGRGRSGLARTWRERVSVLGLEAGFQFAADDVRVGAVVVVGMPT